MEAHQNSLRGCKETQISTNIFASGAGQCARQLKPQALGSRIQEFRLQSLGLEGELPKLFLEDR